VPGKTLVQIKNYFQNYKAKLGLDRLALPAGAVAPRRRRSREPEHSSGAYASQPLRIFPDVRWLKSMPAPCVAVLQRSRPRVLDFM